MVESKPKKEVKKEDGMTFAEISEAQFEENVLEGLRQTVESLKLVDTLFNDKIELKDKMKKMGRRITKAPTEFIKIDKDVDCVKKAMEESISKRLKKSNRAFNEKEREHNKKLRL